MALRKNVLTPYLSKFLDAASEINHAVCFAEDERKRAEKRIAIALAKFKSVGAIDDYFVGDRLAISRARQPGEFRLHVPGPGRVTSGENVAKLTTEIAHRQNAFAIAMLYEIAEQYIADAYGISLWQSRKPAKQAKRFRESESKSGSKPTQKGTPAYCSDYARWACRREVSEALQHLWSDVQWNDIHRGVRFGLTYDRLIRAVAYCRNLIVHRNGRVPAERPRKDAVFCWGLACELSKPMVHEAGKAILPDANQTKKLISEVASFAYAAYTAVSEDCGLSIDYEPSPIPARKRRKKLQT